MNIIVTDQGIRFRAKTVEEFLDKCPSYVPEKLKRFMGEYPNDQMVAKIKDKFQDGDEIWYFNDHGIAPRMSEREAIFLVRQGKFVETHLISYS